MTTNIDSSALAERMVPFDNVTAGHKGVMMDASGEIVIKPCSQAELDFYAETNSSHPEFAAITPTYMGDLKLDRSKQARAPLTDEDQAAVLRRQLSGQLSPEEEVDRHTAVLARDNPLDTTTAVVLENLAAGFVHPNIVDLKLGARLWADDFDADKRLKREKVSAETTSGSLGFRVSGMKIWKPQGYELFDRFYGRNLTPETVHESLEALLELSFDIESLRVTIKGIVEAVEHIQHIVQNQESRIYASSLLLIYEGDEAARKLAINEALTKIDQDASSQSKGTLAKKANDNHEGASDSDDEEEPAAKKIFDARIIDFGHAMWTPGLGPDENMLHGLDNVLKVLRGIQDNANKD